MELANIEKLLDVYFEGNTSLDQEAVLREYFAGDDVAPHLSVYQDLFLSFEQAGKEGSKRTLTFPNSSRKKSFWNYGIAAALVVALGISSIMYFGGGPTQDENEIAMQEALENWEKSKAMLVLLSQNLNEGTSELTHISEFTESKNKVIK